MDRAFGGGVFCAGGRPPRRIFRVTACVGRSVHGIWSVQQVPTFLLDANTHGLRTEAEAEAFAKGLLAEVAGVPIESVSVSAVQEGV